MDVARPRRRKARSGAVAVTLAVLTLAGSAVWTLPNLLHGTQTLPTISRANATIDTARYAQLVRSIRASGIFAPDRIQIVAAPSDGTVEALGVRAGSRVLSGSVIATLANPELEAGVSDARAQVAVARNELRTAEEEARIDDLDRRSAARAALGEAQSTNETLQTDLKLVNGGLIATGDLREAKIKDAAAQSLAEIAERKISAGRAGDDAKISVEEATLDRARVALEALRSRTAALSVRAVRAGIVQSVAVDAGGRVAAGGEIVRIADERDLKAVLQVAESDVRGIAPGTHVTLEPEGDSAGAGRVTHIAPVSVNGSVAVDVALARISSNLRPDQNVDATFEIFRLGKTLTIARPIDAADNASIDVFRMGSDATIAYKTRVRLGPGAPDRVSIRSGLNAGDRIIVSDTSAYESDAAIRIANP